MAYRLRYDRRFRRYLKALPGDVRGIARKVIRQLADNPRPGRAKELDDHPGFYRLWLPRNNRLVWNVLDDEQIVDLLYVGPKSRDLYERLRLGRIPKRPEESEQSNG
jgi:mRNA-degrading endonuclease RelE of RelBE toxin-antitoxin system